MYIDGYGSTPYDNIAIAEIANEIACLFYLVGEDDKKSTAFAEYLKTKIAKSIMKHIPFNPKTKQYNLTVRETYGNSQFQYDPIKGIYRLGTYKLEAPVNPIPTIEIEHEVAKEKPAKTKRELARECEFPTLNFNWGFHTQTSLAAGHPMTLFSKSCCNIKLAELLKTDANDRVINQGIDLVSNIQALILERLKTIIEQYTNVKTESDLPYSVSGAINDGYYSPCERKWTYIKKGSKFLNNHVGESLLKVSNNDIQNLYLDIMYLFGIRLDRSYNPVHGKPLEIKQYNGNTRYIAWGYKIPQIDWMKTIFNKSCSKKLKKQDDEYQILFINNSEACEKLIEASKLTNSYIDKVDENMCLSMGSGRQNAIVLHTGLTSEDLEKAYDHCITQNDIYVSNGKTINNQMRENMEKKRAKYLHDLYQKAIDTLPKNTIEEFNKIMSKTEFSRDMKLQSISVKISDQHNSGFAYTPLPEIIFKFKNSPHKHYKNNTYQISKEDDFDTMYFNLDAMKNPDDPVRQMFINNLIDLYNKLYNIDNDFIRSMLKRIGLIKEGFIPEKY